MFMVMTFDHPTRENPLTVGIHHQNWLRERDRLDAELNAIEEKAGVRARHAAFVEYHGDLDLRRLYFSVPDKDMRKGLISQSRRRRRLGPEFSKALLADAKEELAALETPGFTTPWAIPGLPRMRGGMDRVYLLVYARCSGGRSCWILCGRRLHFAEKERLASGSREREA
jgi:hypothetical protein